MRQNDPIPAIEEAHRHHLATLPFDDERDFEDADRGFLGTLADPVIRDDDGKVVWDASTYDFIEGEAPTSVHPSLWRQSTLAARHGLFEVVEGLYQVRGLDLSVMSLIEGDAGVIVVDPLISKETAAAALALYREHRGDRPVTGMIYTHAHLDHFGGALGIVSAEEAAERGLPIIVPEGLVGHAVAENVYAGTAMARRAGYMYGAALARGPKGQVGAGLGQTTSTGHPGIVVPTHEVTATGEKVTVDGVELEFQMAPGTEAPAEFHFLVPRYAALCMAENVTHNLHNLLTLRGALVRDPNIWAHYLTEAIQLFGDRADVMFASHHWPTWGRERLVEYIGIQRDLYKYLHDQTLRMLNKGLTGAEIAEEMTLPPALEKVWGTHGYYGSVSHNVKAIYQRYMGWFDGNPARLWPHPPQALAERYVGAMGGVDRVVDLARTAYDEGDLRWAATLLDHAVFAAPDDAAARELYADTLEQLAYGSENGTWRSFFLSGATELREGAFGTPTATAAPDLVAQLSPEQIFDAIAITVDGPSAWDLDLALDVVLTDLGRRFHLTLRHGVLVAAEGSARDVPLTLTLTKPRLLAVLAGDLASPGITTDGDPVVLERLLGVLDPGDPEFEIVLP
ncbi:alkyl/aryl-sulfatase [Demequina mangrovi]|uniref:Linear primary-alkylsulfatase n=1 Tax=Demequina mangrovi TaxID=1043493 RepID=A0A1H6Z3J1_9MICO|nr:alkyl sulfatase dimerization domain-containing protein [Demequina mangrovi]SEJ48069.1 Alkyl sulfatase BDS1, metallo-beta-lactamase superfamily [Demequina mangrovi]